MNKTIKLNKLSYQKWELEQKIKELQYQINYEELIQNNVKAGDYFYEIDDIDYYITKVIELNPEKQMCLTMYLLDNGIEISEHELSQNIYFLTKITKEKVQIILNAHLNKMKLENFQYE